MANNLTIINPTDRLILSDTALQEFLNSSVKSGIIRDQIDLAKKQAIQQSNAHSDNADTIQDTNSNNFNRNVYINKGNAKNTKSLDDYKEFGVYTIFTPQSTPTGLPLNRISNERIYLLIINNTTLNQVDSVQCLFYTKQNQFFIRYYNATNDIWSEWQKFLQDTNSQAYSTIPQKIGKWVDGTPIWRIAVKQLLTSDDRKNQSTNITFPVKDTQSIFIVDYRLYVGIENSPNIVDDRESIMNSLSAEWSGSLNPNDNYELRGWIEFATLESNIKN